MMNSASGGGMSMGAGGSAAEDWLEELNSQQDRERVIELMLSQERVIELLYEKTFAMTTSDPTHLNYLDEEGAVYHDQMGHFEGAEPEDGQDHRQFDQDEEYDR